MMGEQELTDEQLRELANDGRLTPALVQKMYPGEQARFQDIYKDVKLGREPAPKPNGMPPEPGRWEQGAQIVKELGTGVAKGAGETTTTLGRLASNPVTTALGNVLGGGISRSLYGKEAVTPPVSSTQAFDEAQTHLQPKTTTEHVGKIAEQIGEYLIPGMGESRGIETGLVKAGMARNSPTLVHAAKGIGSTVQNALGAATVSGLHGETKPEHEAAAGAAVPLATGVISRMLPIIEKLAPYAIGSVAGGLAGSALGGMTGGAGGLALGLGTGAVARNAAKLNPAERQVLEQFVRTYGPKALQMLVGAYGEWRVRGQQKEGAVEQQLRQLQGAKPGTLP